MKINFFKYQGTGNDFIMIDDRSLVFPTDNNQLVAKLCDRRFGIGADGLILLQPHANASYFMKYYNSDGNESTMCGNGGRCLAAFAIHQGVVNGHHTFQAIDGPHEVISEGASPNPLWIQLRMQDVQVIQQRAPYTFVLNTGSPHYVAFSNEVLETFRLVDQAKQIRYNEEFQQEGINVNFVNLLGLKHISMRTYERGVEDETLSCGTGVTAAALATAVLNQLPEGHHELQVDTRGGKLQVSFDYQKKTQSFTNVWLQGPATFVFSGTVEI